MQRHLILPITALALALPATAGAATIARDGDTLVVTGTAVGETVLLDDSYNPPDPAQTLRFDGTTYTQIPAGCAQRDDSIVDCTPAAHVRIDLLGGNDRFSILNQLSVPLDTLTVDGGDGDDSLDGDHMSDRAEILRGGAGKDALDGFGGDDALHGGPGDDVVEGKAGNDRVYGDDGNDEVSGDGQAAPGADVIDGGAGSDILDDFTEFGTDIHPPADVLLDGQANDGRAGEGDNITGIERTIAYVNGNHVLTDGPEDWQVWSNVSSGGASTVQALGGDDRVVGEDGMETIDGGAGNDYLEGGKNHDTIVGGPGQDVIFGDDTDGSCNEAFPESCVNYGNDVIDARDGEADQVDCGAGTDRATVDALDVVAANCETVERGSGGNAPVAGTPRLRAPGGRLAKALKRGLTVRLSGFGPGKVVLQARHGGRRVARGTATVGADGTARVRLRFRAKAKRQLRKRKAAKLAVSGGGVRMTVRLAR